MRAWGSRRLPIRPAQAALRWGVMAADPSKIVRRLSELTADRQQHEQVWDDCYQYSYPQRGNGLLSMLMNANDAQLRKARIMDSTATDSIKIGSATLVNGTVPSNARWFALDVGNETDESAAGWTRLRNSSGRTFTPATSMPGVRLRN